MISIQYTSDFSEDELDFSYDNGRESVDFGPLFEELETTTKNWCSSRELDFTTMLEHDQLLGSVEAIISVTGDDEIQTTNCLSLPPLHFMAGAMLSQIKLSEKDTGISFRKGNYTEGWILLPPNREASFDSVQRRHQREGVGLVLDIPKLKQTSAVRKQSSLEFDLESKFSDLYKASEWVDEDWFTYDYCQMNLILATVTFDYKNSDVFPFLYKTEGGCGGKPPWNNVHTVVSALHYHKGGKAKDGILRLMEESHLIQKNKLKPKDSIFTQASHYAQVGNRSLGMMIEAHRFMKTMTAEQKINLLSACKGDNPLPERLIEKSITIEPENKLIGSAISELRKNGLVMTELDVRLKMISSKKFSTLLGGKPMSDVKIEQDISLQDAKRNGFRLLSEILSGGIKAKPPDNMTKTLSSYYKSRKKRDDITSLSYAGIIRVFKTSDVVHELESSGFGLSDEIVAGLSGLLETEKYLHHVKITRDAQVDWLESNDLMNIITHELPPGFGPDDARIARKILDYESKTTDRFISFVITEDKGMVESLEAISRNRVIRYPRLQYFQDCVKPGKGQKILPDFRADRKIPSEFIVRHCRIMNITKFIVLFDFPNVEREIETWGTTPSGFYKNQGGFLRRSTLKGAVGWSEEEWSSFTQWKDFSTETRTIKVSRKR